MNKKHLLLFFSIIPALVFSQNLATFTQVGPVKFPDNPSVQTTGMGRVSHLVYHPTDSNTLFAVTASGGVFKTSNEGTTWRPISDFLPQTSCASLAINPLNPKVMYLGTGDANYNGGGLGVWKTLNGGASWFQSSFGLGNKLVSYILFTPNDTNTLIAACSDGIYKSSDAGGNWVKKTTVSSSYRDLQYQPLSNKIIYSATNTFFYRSYDNGNTWKQSTINSSITCAGIKIAVCPKDTSKLFCVVWKSGAGSPFGGIYKSVNNGATFTLQADTPNILGYSSNGKSMDGQGAYNLAIANDPNNSNILYIAGINIWKSINQGLTFTLKSPWAYGVHADKHGFLFSPYNPNKIFVYHDGGLDRSTDGGNTWTTLEDGLSASEFYKIGNSALYNDYIIGGLQDNGMDVAIDKKFYTVRGGDWTGDFAFDAFNSKLLYENGGLKRNILTNATGKINGKNGIYAVHPNDSNVMFEATTDLFRTKNLRAVPDSNVSWARISGFTGNTKPVWMACSKISKGTFYVAFTPQALYKSIDINSSAPSFAKITGFPFKSGEEIKQLETCDYDSNILYVLTNQSRILKSKDKGNSWTSLNKNLPSNTIIKFLLDQKNNDSSMYVCTAFGVFYRNKSLANWINFSQGLPGIAQISDMEIMSDGTSSGRLHISTYGRGIWQSDLYKSTSSSPVADFIIQPTTSQTCANTVILMDNSINSPSSRKWEITPAKGWNYINGTDSASARPEVQFNTAGSYFISLDVRNANGNNIKTLIYNYSNSTLPATCVTTTNILGGFDIGIFRFEFNTINKSSGAGTYSYEDFSCNSNTIVKAGGTYTATVTNGGYNNENAKIFIDYNNNGVFTDANELAGTITSGKGRHSCNITILANPPVINKFIRMRIVSDFSNVTSPCGNLSYGQSEDYSVLIDKTRPTVIINIQKPSVSNHFIADFKLSEAVTGFDAGDVNVNNASLSNFTRTGALNYSAKITPADNGNIKIDVMANGFIDLAGNLNFGASDSTRFFLGIKSFTFAGISVADSLIQTPAGGSIICHIPFAKKSDSLKAAFIISDSSFAFVGSARQYSGISKNNFKTVLTYIIKSKDSSLSKLYTVTVIVDKNTECQLLNYGFVNPGVNGNISQSTGGGTVNIIVPFGTSLTNLVAVFNLSDSATAYIAAVKQISKTTSNNFTSQVIYKIVAQDTAYFKKYSINVFYGKSKACDMLTFSIKTPYVTGIITPAGTAGGNISAVLPFGSSMANLTAIFTASDSAKVYIGKVPQQSGVTTNSFSTILNYRIVAQDTSVSKTYSVKITIAPNDAAELISYKIVSPNATGIISTTPFGGYVDISVPFNTILSNLVANFVLSDSARAFVGGTLQYSSITPNNFTDTLVFMVKAQNDLVTKKYLVYVKKAANSIPVIYSEKLKIYPNPATSELHISSDLLQKSNPAYKITDVLGQKIMGGKLELREKTLDISGLLPGIYYLQIQSDDEFIIGKFMKERL